jgi:taurine dioxygenase
MSYQKIQVEPLAPAIGAEIYGVDLSKPLENETLEELQRAFAEHQVIFFRDQDISRDEHKDFARHFGELHVHPVLQQLKDEGHPEIVVLESGEGYGSYVAGGWHSDVTFQRQPPLGSILRCVKAPAVGGDTMWASMYAAYEGLSGTMQNLLGQLEARHAGALFNALAQGDEEKKSDLEANDQSVHPVIRTHPVTGRKALFVNMAFTRDIVGMKPKESALLLEFLYDHLGRAEYTCRFHWREGSIAMWDNRCTQHRVLADNLVDHRRMERVTLMGDAPV